MRVWGIFIFIFIFCASNLAASVQDSKSLSIWLRFMAGKFGKIIDFRNQIKKIRLTCALGTGNRELDKKFPFSPVLQQQIRPRAVEGLSWSQSPPGE